MSCIPIINGPVELYWAPVGTAFPAVDAAPIAPWTLIGQSGSNHYSEDGVTVNLSDTFETLRTLGTTYGVCTFRTETEATVSVTLVEASMETLRLALNLNAIQVDAGPPSIEFIDLNLGSEVAEVALLIRGEGKSAIFDGGNLQFEIRRAAIQQDSEIAFVKGDSANLTLNFMMLLDTSGGFPGAVGRIVQQAA